jgi:hypothetical protein
MKKLFILPLLFASAVANHTSSNAAGPEVWDATCFYVVDQRVQSEVPCVVKVYASATSATEEWEWQNGAHTVVKMSDEGTFVDGQRADEKMGEEIIGADAYCYALQSADNIFCWSK